MTADQGIPDMPVGEDMPVDADMGVPPDMEEDMGDVIPGQWPRELVLESAGSKDAILLKGTVLAPEGVIVDGEVLVSGTLISCVAEDCSGDPAAQGATVIDTRGIISPGLIDGHNHIAYNFLPEWVPSPGKSFTNRYQWADDPEYENHVLPYTANRSRNSHFCPGSRWGELRSLIHGTTTIQGQSFDRTCTQGGVRNADHEHELQYDHMRTTIGSPRDITDSDAEGYLASFDNPVEPITRFALHMGEGFEGNNIELEFSSFAGRDTRNNRHMGVSLLYKETALLIHAVALTDEELEEVAATNSRIVWSPSSNMVLYGRTSNIDRILELGITTGIGPDWTISGEDDMLGELDFALEWARENGSQRVTPEALWKMATVDGADAVGLGAYVGRLEAGAVADITVFARRSGSVDAYEQLVTSKAKDVRLVMIDGDVYYGERALQSAVAWRDDCEALDVCGSQKFACVALSDSDPYDSIATLEGLLIDILVGNGYPDDEQYGRGDELLPLFDCAR